MRLCNCLLVGLVLVNPATAQEDSTAAKPLRITSPLSPEESLKHLVLADPNLVIEIVAAEPEVIDPVAMQFDEHGRLWVVEMRDYPTGPQNAPPPLGGPDAKPLSRIKLLEDKDGDGRFETAHVFADNLLFATGVQPWDGGVIVTHSGEIVYLKDTDGDHKADVREVWFTGFSETNTQLRANHPTFGPDGWIYVANGLRGGNVIAVKKDWPVKVEGRWSMVDGRTKTNADHQPSTINPQPTGVSHDPANPVPVSLTGRDFKFDPLTGRYEAISGNGQFGMTFDAWGNRFVCDNRHPCRHVIFEEDFIRRCPHVAFPAVVNDVIPPDDKNKVFPLTSAWTTSNLHAGTFTAACGVTVYTGDWLPEDYRGNVFVCEPTGNLVQRAVLEPDGVTFKSRNPHERSPHAPREDQPNAPSTSANKSTPNNPSTSTARSADLTRNVRATLGDNTTTQEFLASRDDWFRPVDLQNGPDGALYVVDMYRAVIEHPEWVPDELKNRPDTWLGNDKGRIYRIRPKDQLRKKNLFAELATMRTPPFGQLRDDNGWIRTTSRRLAMLAKAYDPETLASSAYDSRFVGRMKVHYPLGQSTLPTPRDDEEQPMNSIGTMLSVGDVREPNVRHRFQALQQLTLHEPVLATRLLIEFPTSDLADPWMRQGFVAVVRDVPALALAQFIQSANRRQLWQQPGLVELTTALSEQIGAHAGDGDLGWAVARLTELGIEPDNAEIPDSWEVAVSGLIGIGKGMARRGQTLASKWATLPTTAKEWLRLIDLHCGYKLLVPRINVRLAYHQDDTPRMKELAARWLRYSTDEKALETLKVFLEEYGDAVPSLRQAAFESFTARRDPEVDGWLLARYPAETPAIRRAILSALFASKERQLALLGAIEEGKIAATEIDPVRAKQLTESKDEAVREKAKQVLAAAAPASRKEVLEAYQSALTLKGDPQRGREVFQKNCVTCHRVGDLGVNVAPDISDTRTKKPEQLLLDILDPNRAIDANYFAYAVVTKDGKTESGVIASESSNSITLKQPEGKTLTLLRSDIEELRNTGLSLMPVGVEKNINPQQMADLIFWLKNWRYLDGKVPATSLK
jgi:putative membrane-bound dehydrogenase-like protein